MGIEIYRLRRQYGAFVALDDVSLTIGDGEFVAVLGPSGSGKTSLLRILAGLDQPDAGSVYRDGQDLLALDARRRGVGLVFQHYALFPHMTVAQNVAFGLRVRPWRLRPKAAVIKAGVEHLLRQVELEGFADRYPSQLSGGQRQRVALARALAIEPRLLLLDEPFGALDAQVRVNLRRWLREFHRSLGITTLFVTHDQDEALEMADRVVVMNRGRIEQIGTPEQIYRQPATPFASRFIARGQSLPGEVRGQHLHVFGHAWRMENFVADDAHEITVHVRPEDIALAPVQSDGVKAQLLNLRHVAGTVRASLRVENREEPLEAEWNERDWARHAATAGDTVDIHLLALTVFATDEEGRIQARSTVHPPHASFPVAVGPWRRVEA
ncbi:sulfate/molybdate ABC transporter ATP-binding protein [Dyella nitratireducens]|uniref:Sulfate/thiosulfate import ATP-binding protein CysA n=1 Tax=Dyella nitratireducens TaxID=1849580 RepID=A0ABQ1GQF0_9GAMM|nr:sulfate/molybdate ABC transporter ATP-binding protein [Dyella nitratireducens]GGA47627.1 sulfate/thiosulfate import ATP-binding protein CysA [Dyella nitratireducens]GLQ42424.1 sulfate/thiosulfate import ATP-binding protein CysA [Dyella nitratireducens]